MSLITELIPEERHEPPGQLTVPLNTEPGAVSDRADAAPLNFIRTATRIGPWDNAPSTN